MNTEFNPIEKYGPTTLPESKSEHELRESKAEVLELGKRFIQGRDWKALEDLVRSLPDNDFLVTQTTLLQELNDGLFDVQLKPGPANRYFEEGDGWETLRCATEIIRKMGNNPSSSKYLHKVMEMDRIPKVVLKEGQAAITNDINAGADLDIDVRWFYYRALTEAFLKFPDDRALLAVKQILNKIDQQVLENTRHYYYPEGKDITGSFEETPQELFDYQFKAAESNMPSDLIAGISAGDMAVGTKSFIIKKLGGAKQPESLPMFLEVIKLEGSDAPIYFHPILEALRQLDQNLVADKLLNLVKSGNPFEKRSALWLLYRLEIGQVGVSEEGVHYLHKVYDVGNYNNPNYYVQRLTSGGQVGIFSQEGKFEKYFNLEGLGSEEQRIRAKLLDITYATLFGHHAKEKPEERKQRTKLLEEFQLKYFEFLQHDFFNDLPVKFSDLTFPEQGQFLKFYSDSEESERARLKDYCKKFGLTGFRSLMSLDYDGGVAAKLLDMAESLPQSRMQMILDKYVAIVSAADTAEMALWENLPQSANASPDLKERVREFIMEKGSRFLRHLGLDESEAFSHKDTIMYLSGIRTEVMIYAALFKELSKINKLSITDIKDARFDIVPAKLLSEDDKKQMLEIFANNRDESYPLKLREATLRSFEQTLQAEGPVFRVLKYKGSIVSFFHAQPQGEDAIYVGSLNLSPDAQDSSIAVSMVVAALEQAGTEKNITAKVWSKNEKLYKFYKRYLHFQDDGVEENYEGTGENYYKLKKPKQEESTFAVAA